MFPFAISNATRYKQTRDNAEHGRTRLQTDESVLWVAALVQVESRQKTDNATATARSRTHRGNTGNQFFNRGRRRQTPENTPKGTGRNNINNSKNHQQHNNKCNQQQTVPTNSRSGSGSTPPRSSARYRPLHVLRTRIFPAPPASPSNLRRCCVREFGHHHPSRGAIRETKVDQPCKRAGTNHVREGGHFIVEKTRSR